jgi:molybdopterin molybdotransferase
MAISSAANEYASSMITIEEALERILNGVEVLPTEEKHPIEALGQVLDEEIYAQFDIPPLANTAMDGYAVRSADTAGASPDLPRELQVIGELPAGRIYQGEVSAGTALRIMTGAPLPPGADAIVPFEETDELSGLRQRHPHGRTGELSAAIRVFKEASPGANVRSTGEDVRAGELVLRRGTVLRPSEIGVIASLGRDRVRVIRRPVVAVLSTGDELLEPGQPRSGAQIYDANAYSVGALVSRYGGVPQLLGIARDTVEELTAKIRECLEADLLVTSAGVSRGDYDIVKDVLAREGKIAFCMVAMKPGKPLAFGIFQKDGRPVPHIGLPGNPVSSMVAFELFGRPAILKMMGKTDLRRPVIRATAEERFVNHDDDRVFLARCIVTERRGQYYVKPTGEQGSGMLTSMIHANGLTIIPAEVDVVEIGDQVQVLMLDWSHGEECGSCRTE